MKSPDGMALRPLIHDMGQGEIQALPAIAPRQVFTEK
jgi:hypothetical protein